MENNKLRYVVFWVDHYERNISQFDTFAEAENFVNEIETRSDGPGGGTNLLHVFEITRELEWTPVKIVERLVLVTKKTE